MVKTKNEYINREISWLQFNARVLQESKDPRVPLIDRLRFLGIFSNNLDEFFKVRYATVKRIVDAGKTGKSVLGGEKAKDLLEEITKIVIDQQARSLVIFKEIDRELREKNIFIIRETEVNQNQAEFIRDYFFKKVNQELMTIILNDLTEFPLLKDTAAYLAVKIVMKNGSPGGKHNRYALIEIPKGIDRFVVLPKEGDKDYVIQITRDAELDIDNDLSKSFIEKISSSVEHRKISDPVRFVYDKSIDKDTLQFLKEKMDIMDTDSVIPGGRYHNRRDYMGFPSLGRQDLMYDKIEPLPVKGLSMKGSLLDIIAHKDYMIYAPYHTFSYVTKFLREAALDPQVRSIKITIYRLASDSQIASALVNAVKNGKQVTVQIELQARFDEQNNIEYANYLQDEGVQLIFGVPGLKVHSKICLVEREEEGGLKRYGFISTGNFNESTAKIYTDYTLFTAHQGILKDMNKVFGFFETNYKINKYKHLIVSPHYTKSTFMKLIDREIACAREGKEAYIKIKMNSLTSYKMVDKLYEASRAGVKIKMIVRGICCLIPGVEGMSENIEAISVVDKFLEHPRLFIFGNGGDPKIYISSADWMTRNLDFRVEVGCPIYDEDIRQELLDTFEISWNDNSKARIFSAKQDNAYRKRSKGAAEFRSQFEVYDYYKRKLES
nr:polyphosphate kinase 1 [Allomuricauda sp.]